MENTPIPLKTSNPDFNRHDFVQTDCGLMEELTVEITLAEYRELVSKCALQQEQLFRYMMERDAEKRKREIAENKSGSLEAQLDEANNGREILDDALFDAREKNEALESEIKTLRGEVGRQTTIIADLKTRLSNEIRHQNYVKENDNAEG